MSSSYFFHIVSSLVKARLQDDIHSFAERQGGTALRGDRHFFSALVTGISRHSGERLNLSVDSVLGENVIAYAVDHVPVRFPCYPTRHDDDYLDTEPGLYPDLLRPAVAVYARADQLSQLHFEVRIPADLAPGSYPIRLILSSDENGETVAEATYTVEVLDALLPEGKMTVTHWFHYDSLAVYYNVKVFSEEHWQIVENYLHEYVDRGSNALLTPIFTPPLDTKVGGERPTVQLVDVTVENGKYIFGFDKLKRFCEMCHRVGIRELEIAHFFTQWGAAHAPKIMATVDGEEHRIFGWDSEAAGEAYIGFLRALIPELKAKLDEYGYRNHYFFHISDEPSEEHLSQYARSKNAILDLICDHPVRDALSNVEFYRRGVITAPIPSNDHVDAFLAEKVHDLWVYYCCGQVVDVSNRFLSMPGYRTRVMGAQMYKANITGFLHWGYNFYFNRFSIEPTNPFTDLSGDLFTPAGDNFMVYPGRDGKPLHSLHELLFEQALLDMRAMDAAAARVGREAVIAAIDAEGEVGFASYPKNEDYLLTLRNTVNRMAAK